MGLMVFMEAIARMEGWLDLHSRPRRNNNPGDIEWGKFAQAHGADSVETPIGNEPARFAHFPDPTTGFRAMRALLQAPLYAGKTVSAVIYQWAPPSDGNNTENYINCVCKWCGCKPTDIIDGLLAIPVSGDCV